MILAVCRSALETFLIAIVNGLAERICSVLICLVIVAATIVAIGRGRVEVWIPSIVRVPAVVEGCLLLTLPL